MHLLVAFLLTLVILCALVGLGALISWAMYFVVEHPRRALSIGLAGWVVVMTALIYFNTPHYVF